MRRFFTVTGLCLVATVLTMGGMSRAGADSNWDTTGLPQGQAHVCRTAIPLDVVRCNAIIRIDIAPNTATPTGLAPSDLQSAYNLAAASAANGSGQTVAIVDAYDDPNAEADLAIYRSTFGLPACTSANGCFKKVGQTGSTTQLPAIDTAGWSQEESLDLDMVSAICPNCHILLVETTSNSNSALGAGVNAAVRLGANAVSNSYGGTDGSRSASLDSYYNHPGVAITASSGDGGYGVEYPAASQYVTAVGGTTLTKATSTTRGWTETVWSGAGSGCSRYETKPSWQTDASCSKRTVADVAAVANPSTGVSVYDTYNCGTACGGYINWIVFGGTSVASPIIASVYALAGNEASLTYAQSTYTHASSLYDVTSGSNGSCRGTYLCTGKPGYDGPTGNGTPNGTGAF